MSALSEPAVRRTLDRLHSQARGDWKKLITVVPAWLRGRLSGRSTMESITPAHMRDVYIPVTRADGELLYVLARSMGARRIVEFGCSFGISTLYLAAAARDGGGSVVTTEIEPTKVAATRQHLQEAGLGSVAQVLEGDALVTLQDIEGPVDLLFLDGWKNLYVPVLELMRPKLREGALVVADNVNLADTQPYVAHVQQDPAFTSATLAGGRAMLSCYSPASGTK
jgi:predicted O-methyltransferase YrrM